MLASVIVLLIFGLSFVLLPLSLSFGMPKFTQMMLMIQIYLTIPVLLTTYTLGIIGPVLCLSAPREVRGTSYLIFSIFINGVSLAFTGLSMLITVPAWLSFCSLFLPLASILFFVLFLGRLATFLNVPALNKLIRSTLILAGSSVILSLSTTPATKFLADIDPSGAVVKIGFPILSLVLGLFAFVRYLTLLEGSRRASLARSRE
jgi:hypothetical protein